MADFSATDLEVWGSSPASASLIPDVRFVDVQLRVKLSLCSLPGHSAKCTGNRK